MGPLRGKFRFKAFITKGTKVHEGKLKIAAGPGLGPLVNRKCSGNWGIGKLAGIG